MVRVLVKHPDLNFDGTRYPLGECEMPENIAKCYADRNLVEILDQPTLEVATPTPKKRTQKTQQPE